jgi:peptidyl-prolyl cis-trans isomerase B (cyclophilin B)
MDNPIVTITMKNKKKIEIELYPDIAPNTVNNFISLVRKGYYDGLIFHRVIPGFMIQGGCPDGTGAGNPGYKIKGEFSGNGFKNPLKHDRGILSMARSQSYDSAGSQFFIMVKKSPHLDSAYASFGEVISGMEEVDRIVESKKDYMNKPLEDQIMKKVEVDTKGKDYPEPEKV